MSWWRCEGEPRKRCRAQDPRGASSSRPRYFFRFLWAPARQPRHLQRDRPRNPLAITTASTNNSGRKSGLPEAELSLRALSDQAEISASTLGEYERGVKVPEADKLARIAETS
ncbi:MAG: helix-turn-helix domain-containing protein [Terriglobales bacterium]